MQGLSLRALPIAAGGLLIVAACSAVPTSSAKPSRRSPVAEAASSSAPSPSSTASSTSPASEHLGPCPPAALKLGRDPRLSPATGENGVILTITSVARPCAIVGFPAITLPDSAGSPLPFTYLDGKGQYVTHRRPLPVTVGEGSFAYVLVAKYRCDTGYSTLAEGMNVQLPGQGTIQSVPGSWIEGAFAYCTGGTIPDPGNTVDVSPFEPTADQLDPWPP